MLIADIANVLLAGNILPGMMPQQDVFARPTEAHLETFSPAHHGTATLRVQAVQIQQLVEMQLIAGREDKLRASDMGKEALVDAERTALRWWSELLGGTAESETGETSDLKTNSVFSIGGNVQDEEVELSVAVLVSDVIHQGSS